MKLRMPHVPPKVLGWCLAIAVAVPAVVFRETWYPTVEGWVKGSLASEKKPAAEHAGAGASETEAGHAHAAAESLELSEKALRNLGLTPEFIKPIELTTYRRSITVPALVTERPGRTRLQVATPMTGVILHVHAVSGEAIAPGALLFRVRLTHEDLVQAQTEFLKSLGELEVESRWIAQLTDAAKSGAIPRTLLLDREYAKYKLEALLSAQREALKLHGLSEGQVDQIVRDRRLLRELQVFAPGPDDHSNDEIKLTDITIQRTGLQQIPDADKPKSNPVPLVISDLHVHKGQSVSAGETLCVLSDYSDLNIEGLAFEQDAGSIAAAADRKWPVTAVIEQPGNQSRMVEGLQIIRLSNEVDADSRTLRFYVRIPNEIESLTANADGNRFVGWRYRPGQRLQLRVPVEEWPNEIVLPVDAVTKEGAEFYVFQQNGSHFDRIAVHVKYQDQASVVIANDGTLFPGDIVAMRGAHQMQMALKNKSGGGVDPHAGHNH